MKFLSLLLCFELVISPVQGSLFLPAVALAETCPAGQAWSDSVGRCQVTAQTINDNNAVDICGDDKDCLEKIASDKAGASEGNGAFGKNGMTTTSIITSAVAVGIPLLIVTTVLAKKAKANNDIDKNGKKTSFRCRPASLLLLYAAGAALAVGEVYGAITHKNNLDEIERTKEMEKQSEEEMAERQQAIEMEKKIIKEENNVNLNIFLFKLNKPTIKPHGTNKCQAFS